jgi:hypothetical protein
MPIEDDDSAMTEVENLEYWKKFAAKRYLPLFVGEVSIRFVIVALFDSHNKSNA